MNPFKKSHLFVFSAIIMGIVYAASCTNKDIVEPSKGPHITRGTDNYTLGVDKWKLDKAHSSTTWEIGYLGTAGLLTGRFNMFGITSLKFDESKAENISFEGWVRLNTVNTGEPNRDGGCLLGTFGTAAGKVDEPENLAILKSKKAEFSTTDKGYIVTCDMAFLGATREVTGKLLYLGKSNIPASGTNPAYDIFSLKYDFQFLAKTDFSLVSGSVGDNASVTLNLNFNNR